MDLLIQNLDVPGRKYDVEHHDTEDQRGIDVAFIYDKKKLKAEAQFFHVILKRTGTRDLFQVNFRTNDGKLLVLIGNHWPSRTGGELDSEPYRILAGETLAYWLMRIPEKTANDDVAVVVAGDFNDEPFNRSIMDHALGSNNEKVVLKAKIPRLFNLMWPFLEQGLGSYCYDKPNMLDQFMVSKGILNEKSGFKIQQTPDKKYLVNIEMFSEMVKKGDYPKPKKFGRPNKDLNEDGFSDHFPISMSFEEK